jgi:hypothetical protein
MLSVTTSSSQTVAGSQDAASFEIEPTAKLGVVVKMSHDTRRRHCIDRDTLF